MLFIILTGVIYTGGEVAMRRACRHTHIYIGCCPDAVGTQGFGPPTSNYLPASNVEQVHKQSNSTWLSLCLLSDRQLITTIYYIKSNGRL